MKELEALKITLKDDPEALEAAVGPETRTVKEKLKLEAGLNEKKKRKKSATENTVDRWRCVDVLIIDESTYYPRSRSCS